MTLAIDVQGVTVRYGDVVALDGVDLQVAHGTVTGLIGMNGSGKSTLFRTIMGVINPARGSVRVDGEPPQAARASGAVAYVPQAEEVDWSFPVSVRDVVMMGRYGKQGVLRRASRADRAAVDTALDRVGLSDLANRQIGRLSGGQKKRVFVARAIAQDARVLLLDEPFAGVDKPSEAMITRVLIELAAEGRGVIVSTHDLAGLPELARDVVLLRNRVLFHGDVAEGLEPRILARAFGWEEAA